MSSEESKHAMFLGERYEVVTVPEPPPESKTFMGRWKLTGPAWVMMAQEVGSGELITCSFVGARGGFGAAWAILVSAAVKIVNDYLHARYTLYTGEHPTRRYWLLWAGIPMWVLLFHVMVINPVAAGAGIVGAAGTSLMALVGLRDVWPWYYAMTFTVALLVWIVLWFPRWIYIVIENMVKVTYIILYIGLLISAAIVSTPGTIAGFFTGLVSFGYIPPAVGLWTMLSLMGWGFGGDYNEPLRYPMWFTERGWGVTAYKREARRISGIVTKGGSEYRSTIMERLGKGWLPDHTKHEELEKIRLWNKVLIQDLIGIYLPLALYGSLIFIYLGGSILHPRGLAPTGFAVVTAQAEYFRIWLGDFGYYLFLFFAFWVLYPTVLGAWDGTARFLADFFLSFKKVLARRFYIFAAAALVAIAVLPFITTPIAALCGATAIGFCLFIYALATFYLKTFKSLYHVFAFMLGAVSLIMMWAAPPLWFVLLGSAAAVSLLPFGQAVILYTSLKLPREIRPSKALLVWQSLALCFWIIFTILSWLNLFGILRL